MKANAWQRGQVMPLVAIGLVLLMGAAALAVDVGYQRYEQRVQQNAADSAAIAGAADIPYGDVASAARKDATSNGYTTTPSDPSCDSTSSSDTVCVEVHNPPAAPDLFSGNSNAVEVIITTHRPSFFEKVFNVGTLSVSTKAVAKLTTALNNECMYLLNPNDSSNFNNSIVNGPSCGIIDDGTGSNMQGANMNLAYYGYAGSAPNQNKASFTGASPTQTLPVGDPCMEIPGCRALKTSPPSTTPCGPLTQKSGTILPGCFTSLDVSNGNVTLQSGGLFVINGPVNADKATIIGKGVTIYITANGCPSACPSLNFNKTNLDLTAPTSGMYNGVLFYQDPANTLDPNFNKTSSDSLTGLVYFPTSHVNFNKTGGGYVLLVFGAANFNSNTMNFTGSSGGNGLIQQAVLAE